MSHIGLNGEFPVDVIKATRGGFGASHERLKSHNKPLTWVVMP